MGLEAVKEEVIRSAKNQEEALFAEAKKETVRIMNDVEKKIGEIKEKSEIETKRIITAIKKQELASVELENKKVNLEAKKDLMDKVFSEVYKNVKALDNNKRKDIHHKFEEKNNKCPRFNIRRICSFD